jgi:hypothetical protein
MARNEKGTLQLSQAILLKLTPVNGTTPIVSEVDPMAGYDGFSLVLVTTGTVVGAWTIAGADDWFELDGCTFANAGHFGDISDLAEPALVDVTTASVQATQIVPCMFGAIQVTFTPASGTGSVAAYRVKKGLT